MLPRRNEEVASALGRRARQYRRLDFEKSPLVEHAPDAEGDLVAQTDVLLHRRAAQVEVPILEPQLLGRVGAILDDERRRLRAREKVELRGDDLDVPGRHVGSPLPFPAKRDLAFDRDDVLAARLGRAVDRLLRRSGLVEENLNQAAAVAHRQENEFSQIAAAAHPALEQHLPARVGRTKLPRRLACFAHDSLAAPSSSARFCARETSSARRVARSLTVTVSFSRSRPPSRTRGRSTRAARVGSGHEHLRRPAQTLGDPSACEISLDDRPRDDRPESHSDRERVEELIRRVRDDDDQRTLARRGSSGAAATRRSSPIANPTAGIGGPPSSANRLSYRPPPRIASCAPSEPEVTSNTVSV